MLSLEEVEKIAKLAKFDLEDSELRKLRSLLSEALDYVEVLKELDTSQVAETFEITGIKNRFAEDSPKTSLTQREAISNAKQTERGFIVTSAVIEKS